MKVKSGTVRVAMANLAQIEQALDELRELRREVESHVHWKRRRVISTSFFQRLQTRIRQKMSPNRAPEVDAAWSAFESKMVNDFLTRARKRAESICSCIDKVKAEFPSLEETGALEEITEVANELREYVVSSQPDDLLSEKFDEFIQQISIRAAFLLRPMIMLHMDRTAIELEGVEEFAPLDLIQKNPQAVIQHAFTYFEDKLRKRVNADPGTPLATVINTSFGTGKSLVYGSTDAEGERARDFLRGAYGLFRNPRSHQITEDDVGTALSLMVMVHLMLQIVEEAKDR